MNMNYHQILSINCTLVPLKALSDQGWMSKWMRYQWFLFLNYNLPIAVFKLVTCGFLETKNPLL